MKIYNLTRPKYFTSPIVLSIPHCGTEFPVTILNEIEEQLLPCDDTDWFVDQIYSFAANRIPIISSAISRWVIDLNRDPEGKLLYNDGRIITTLCPVTDFLGRSIYKDRRCRVTAEETQRRKTLYFDPYHNKLQELIDETKYKFGKVLLWDCHSIKRLVSSISKEPFPDLVLGSADGTSAPADIIDFTYRTLASDKFKVSQNQPFKGGYITRKYGRPEIKQYALQLEMTKDLYLDETETIFDTTRSTEIQKILKNTLEALTLLLLAS